MGTGLVEWFDGPSNGLKGIQRILQQKQLMSVSDGVGFSGKNPQKSSQLALKNAVQLKKAETKMLSALKTGILALLVGV